MGAYVVSFIRRVAYELMCHSSCICGKSDDGLGFLDATDHFVDCIGSSSANCWVADSSSSRVSDLGERKGVCETGLD